MKTISVPGRCRCGRLRFVLREEPVAFYVCHCTDCQAESGSAFGLSMAVRKEAITAVEGPARQHTMEGAGQLPAAMRVMFTASSSLNSWIATVMPPPSTSMDRAVCRPWGVSWVTTSGS